MWLSIGSSWSSSMNTPSSPASAKSVVVVKNVAALIRVSPESAIQASMQGGRRAAEAVADHRGLALAGRLLDGAERRKRPLVQVILERIVRQAGAGIGPGDHEQGIALVDGELDEAVLGLRSRI